MGYPRTKTRYTPCASMSTMNSKNGTELRLSLIDLFAETISNFMGLESSSPEEVRETKMAAEDISELIAGMLGLDVADGLNEKNEMSAIMSREIPEEYKLVAG